MALRNVHPNSKRSLVVRSKRRAQARDRREGKRPTPPPYVPEMAMVVPEPGPCGKEGCQLVDHCWRHCRKNPKGNFKHELDPKRAKWANAMGDGLFEVACRHCGEVGMVYVDILALEIDWG